VTEAGGLREDQGAVGLGGQDGNRGEQEEEEGTHGRGLRDRVRGRDRHKALLVPRKG
jgi:hypothetical protein